MERGFYGLGGFTRILKTFNFLKISENPLNPLNPRSILL